MKPGAFLQLYVHLVLAVKHRESLLVKEIRNEVFSYIGGIIRNRKCKPIIINGVLDHIHILLGFNPNEKISDLVGAIKKDSSSFINKKEWCNGNFHWQDGYGAFTYSKSQLRSVYRYIENQEKHHSIETFHDEYINLLEKYEIEYNEKYLFEFFQ